MKIHNTSVKNHSMHIYISAYYFYCQRYPDEILMFQNSDNPKPEIDEILIRLKFLLELDANAVKIPTSHGKNLDTMNILRKQ